MPRPKFSKFELQILEAFWTLDKASISEVQESFPEPQPHLEAHRPQDEAK